MPEYFNAHLAECIKNELAKFTEKVEYLYNKLILEAIFGLKLCKLELVG
jgi:hypothetical protein